MHWSQKARGTLDTFNRMSAMFKSIIQPLINCLLFSHREQCSMIWSDDFTENSLPVLLAGTACFRRDMMQSLVVPQKRWDAARRQSSVPCHALMCNLMNNAYFFLRGTSQSTVVPDPGLIKAFCRQWCSSSLPLSVCTVCSREPACQRIKGGNRRETHAQLPGVSSPPKHPASSHDDNLPV